MSGRTIEQERARNALYCAREMKANESAFTHKYRSYVDRMGPAIVMNGLGQALATELAAGGDAHRKLYQNLSRWLCRRDGGVYRGRDDVLRSIMEEDQAKYLVAQAEALAWLEWHKKFCRVFFPKGTTRD